MPSLRVSGLYRYPVKSLGGEAFSSLEVGARGPEFDRHWMVVDADGRFITQRQQPRMCLIQARIGRDKALWLAAPGMPEIRVGEGLAERLEVRVWEDALSARATGPCWSSCSRNAPPGSFQSLKAGGQPQSSTACPPGSA